MEELYDLRRDPVQEHNLISDSSHAQILTTLRGEWQRAAIKLK
jgi:hypothetical protein